MYSGAAGSELCEENRDALERHFLLLQVFQPLGHRMLVHWNLYGTQHVEVSGKFPRVRVPYRGYRGYTQAYRIYIYIYTNIESSRFYGLSFTASENSGSKCGRKCYSRFRSMLGPLFMEAPHFRSWIQRESTCIPEKHRLSIAYPPPPTLETLNFTTSPLTRLNPQTLYREP